VYKIDTFKISEYKELVDRFLYYGVTMINYDDNRDFYRMMINSQVTVTVIDDEVNSTITAVCRDLSATGMAIEMPHPITLDTSVRVYVDAAGSSIASLDVKGKVVRCIQESEECYLLGINISEID